MCYERIGATGATGEGSDVVTAGSESGHEVGADEPAGTGDETVSHEGHYAMSGVRVIPVTTRGLRRAFLGLPWRLYRDDPLWMPPIRFQQAELTGIARHPFYQQAAARQFLALRGGEPVGRIAAIRNDAHNRRYGDRLGFFGFFESVDDAAVSGALLEAATGWLNEQGMAAVRGPVNPSLNYECGLLVDGFDRPPVFMMTYNPPFYARLLEQFGFRKAQDLYAYYGHVDMVPALSEKHAAMHRAVIERFDIRVRQMDRRRFQKDVAIFLELYNQSLAGTWGFVPLSPAEMRRLASDLGLLIVPKLTRIAEVDGRPIGALLGLLDYNPRIQAIDGRVFPFGFIRLLWNKRAIKRMRFITANVLPEYQQWGVGLMLMREFLQPVLEGGIEEVEFSWVLESNALSWRSLEKGSARRYKTYRIYDRAV